jgi:hypothetical protein
MAGSKPLAFTSIPIPTVDDMTGAYRCGDAVSHNAVRGILVEEGAGTTTHFPLSHPQLPAPQSKGPSQDAVHKKLHTWIDAWFTQLVGWQHWAGTQSSPVMQVWLSGGAVVATDVGVAGIVVVFDGEGEGAVQPARRKAPIQMAEKISVVLSI